jgi:hypothetical protein
MQLPFYVSCINGTHNRDEQRTAVLLLPSALLVLTSGDLAHSAQWEKGVAFLLPELVTCFHAQLPDAWGREDAVLTFL